MHKYLQMYHYMRNAKKKINYPENLPLKKLVSASGRSITWYAEKIGVSRLVVSNTVNGHYKGMNIVPKLQELLNQ